MNKENKNMPDVIALPFELAERQLKDAGFEIEIEKTYPTKPAKGNGLWRVIRQKVQDGKVVLLIAEECQGVSGAPGSPE